MNTCRLSACAAVLFTMLVTPVLSASPPVVQIDSGALQGVRENGIDRYLGIPYAAPPVGELRWRTPRPVAPWDGVRSAASYGHACPQFIGAYSWDWANDALEAAGLSEDCLTVNIWAPTERGPESEHGPESDAESGPELLPVMFYIHGGNMSAGSNVMPLYNGADLARQGVVTVFVNYRLGYLGRFAHPALSRLQADEALGNYGLFDQIAALEWVQRNITAFGGDPNDVTIFGHSAGGVSVNLLMVATTTEGLFHKAIAQGSAMQIDATQHISESLPRGLIGRSWESIGNDFAEYFGATGSDTDIVATLRAVSWQDIIAYQQERMMQFNPMVDGEVIAEDVARTFERGAQHDVPYIGGANSWEWGQLDKIPLIGKWFMAGAMLEGLSDEDLAPFDEQWTRIGVSQQWFASLFLTSTRYFAQQMANVASPAWLFHVDYQQTAVRGQSPGSAHGLEMPYLFGQIAEHPEYQRPDPAAAQPPSAEDLAWGRTVQAYWLNFAKTGNPNGPGLPEWPEYRPGTDLTLVMGERFTPVAGLDSDRLDYLVARALERRKRFATQAAGVDGD